MPRTARIQFDGAVYHVLDRGNNRQDIYLSKDDRKLFLDTLQEVCEQTGWRIHAYVLMSNHYHMLLETPEANLVDGMGWFQQTYTQRFNRRNHRSGHLYQGRYKSLLVQAEADADYFREVAAYIHLNPFRARLAGWPEKPRLQNYPWSSYPYYVKARKKAPGWLHLDRLYSHCGWSARNPNVGSMYRTQLNVRMAQERDPSRQKALEQAYRPLRRGWCFGDDVFRKQMPGHLDSGSLQGMQRMDHGEWRAEELIRKALTQLGLRNEDLLAMKNVSLEKCAVAWLVKSQTVMTAVWISSRLNMRHRMNVSRALSTFRKEDAKPVKRLKKKLLQCSA